MIRVIAKDHCDYPRKFDLLFDKSSNFIVKELLDSFFDVEKELNELISTLQEEQLHYAKKGYKVLIIESYYDYESTEAYGLFGFREPTESEIKRHKEEESIRQQTSAEARRKQYEQLKKEFGNG